MNVWRWLQSRRHTRQEADAAQRQEIVDILLVRIAEERTGIPVATPREAIRLIVEKSFRDHAQ